jgi:microcystin-dependent protein
LPFNGAGVFTRLYSWVSDKAAGLDITASRMDADSNDIIVSGLGNCLTRDGQGGATANLPMNGFRHTGAGQGVNPGDYATMGQIAGTAGAAVGATPIGGGMDFFGTTAPAGWHFAAGAAISRTTYAALFAVIGTTYGAGDGSTTFNLPDIRGRIPLPLDNLGGTAAGRVNVFAATAVGATGGSQSLQSHSHAVTDSGHTHTVAISDPTHSHGVTDPQHSHPLTGSVMGAGSAIAGAAGSYGFVANYTALASTGVSVNAAATGVTASAGVAATGITTQTAGAGNAQNMPPVLVCTYIIYAGV